MLLRKSDTNILRNRLHVREHHREAFNVNIVSRQEIITGA